MKKILLAALFAPLTALAQTYPSPTFQNVTIEGTLSASGTVSGAGVTALLGPYALLASPTFTGTVTLPKTSQTATGQFFASNGAQIDRLNDRVFVGTATQYDGNQTPSTGDWSLTTYPVTGGQGAFQYLVSGAELPVGIIGGNLGVTAYGRTSDGSGGGTQATIGMSSFGVNDNSTGGGAALWAYYGSVVRAAAATGSNTNTMELDVANLGSTVRQYPNAMYPNGLTDGIGVNAGGELQNDSSVTMGTNSAGITISQNDATGHANWDKGIIFQSTAIAGANGTGGNNTGVAIAMAPGHQIVYYNNSNAITGGFWSSATTTGGTLSQEQYVQLSNFGTLFTDGNDLTQFQVNNTATSAADYLQVSAANAGGAPQIVAVGTDTNINMVLEGKGTGTVSLPQDDVLTYINTSGQSFSSGTAATVTGWTKSFDRIGANFNASTGTFTAPVAGYYHVDAGLNWAANAPTTLTQEYQVAVQANSVSICTGQNAPPALGNVVHVASVSCDVSLTAGQTITIQGFQNSGSAATLATGSGVNYLSIHRLP